MTNCNLILVRPQRMKPSKTQMIIAYAASTFLMLAVFHKPLGLADYWETAFLIATGLCWITFFVLRRRQKSSRSTLEEIASPANPARQKHVRLLSLILMVAVSLSGPWWLPYTGTRLRFPQMAIVAIITCSTSVTIYLIASRRAQRRSNHAMQPIADPSDV
jgi:amino acid transporter